MMGKIYSVACHKCKVYRDLNKLQPVTVDTRESAIALMKNEVGLKNTLLLSFLHEHLGHDCTLVNDSDSEYLMSKIEDEYKEDYNFWEEE